MTAQCNTLMPSCAHGPNGPHKLPLLAFLSLVLLTTSASAEQTSTYNFLANQSTITQTGGIAGINRTYTITGTFCLAVDIETGTASFDHVDANAIDDSPFINTLDPNEVFNLTALAGAILDETTIQFDGTAPDGSSILITLTLADDTIALNGQTTPPPNSADFFTFTLDALAKRKYSGGTGDPNTPYQIATAEDLITLGETPHDYDKHFILTADIDLDPNLPGRKVFDRAVIAPDVNDEQIGFQGTQFTGVFDGNSHVISHVTITGNAYLGLFGYFGSGGRISSLGLEAIDVNGIGDLFGGLTGINDGSITRCYSTGTVNGMNRVGGLVGDNSGNIITSYSTGSVSGDLYVGGLVGWNVDSITTSYSTATVSGSQRVGGLMGTSRGGGLGVHGSIKNCYSTGMVGGDLYVGGLVGENVGGSITKCYSTGMVNGTGDYVSGLVGDNWWWGTVTECFWDMTTSEQTTSDGGTGKTTAEMQKVSTFLDAGWDFVGETENGPNDVWKIIEGQTYPLLSWQKYGGGTGEPNDPYLVYTAEHLNALGAEPNDYDKHFKLMADIDLSGYVYDRAVIAPDISDTEAGFQGTYFTGVFDGNGHKISNLTIEGESWLGLFGLLTSGSQVNNLGVAGVNISALGNHIGGLAGRTVWGSIECCYSTGSVTGEATIGGLIGSNLGLAANCYSITSVSGREEVGGLVGSNGYSQGPGPQIGYIGSIWGSIKNCYSAGSVYGILPSVGGLVGSNPYGEAVNSVWDMEASGQAASASGSGKITAEMQTASSFLNAGWDFVGETENGTEDIWWILEGRDYPRLWWELPGDDFDDGEVSPLWRVYEQDTENSWMEEANGRLEARATSRAAATFAGYVSDGWLLDATKDFALKVRFHYSKISFGDSWVLIGLAPSLAEPVVQHVVLEAGCIEDQPFYLCEAIDGSWRQEREVFRPSDDGTLYISYEADTDKLHVSYTGYGETNAWHTFNGLLRDRWAAQSVHVVLGCGSEKVELKSDDAYLDDFVVNDGTIRQPDL